MLNFADVLLPLSPFSLRISVVQRRCIQFLERAINADNALTWFQQGPQKLDDPVLPFSACLYFAFIPVATSVSSSLVLQLRDGSVGCLSVNARFHVSGLLRGLKHAEVVGDASICVVCRFCALLSCAQVYRSVFTSFIRHHGLRLEVLRLLVLVHLWICG